MTAPILSVLGNIAPTDEARGFLAERALGVLNRPIRHRFCGTLWERVAEGKKR